MDLHCCTNTKYFNRQRKIDKAYQSHKIQKHMDLGGSILTNNTNNNISNITSLDSPGDGGMLYYNNHLNNIDSCDVPSCFVCQKAITERYFMRIQDNDYHSQCVKCSECESLLTSSCYIRDYKFFCPNDFYKKFGVKCSTCREGILPGIEVQKTHEFTYHVKCFHCAICKRELDVGDEYFLIKNDGKIVCKSDYETANIKPDSDGDSGSKRPRTTISARNSEILKAAFQINSKPARHIREQLARDTGLHMRVVQVYLQNRRAKEKRMQKDIGRRWESTPSKNNDSRFYENISNRSFGSVNFNDSDSEGSMMSWPKSMRSQNQMLNSI